MIRLLISNVFYHSGPSGAIYSWLQHPSECISHVEVKSPHLDPFHRMGRSRY